MTESLSPSDVLQRLNIALTGHHQSVNRITPNVEDLPAGLPLAAKDQSSEKLGPSSAISCTQPTGSMHGIAPTVLAGATQGIAPAGKQEIDESSVRAILDSPNAHALIERLTQELIGSSSSRARIASHLIHELSETPEGRNFISIAIVKMLRIKGMQS